MERAGEVLAAIHGAKTEDFGSLAPGLRGSHALLGVRFIDLLAPKVEAAHGIGASSSALLNRASDLLSTHRSVLDAAEPGLVHGDFSPANFLVGETGTLTGSSTGK